MRISNLLLLGILTLALGLSSCKPDDEPLPDPDPDPAEQTYYFLGIETASNPETDILTPASSIESGIVSPVGNGIEQPAWMTFIQGEDQIFVGGYTSSPEFTSYHLENGELVQGSSFFTDLTPYAFEVVDASTMILMGSAREGLTAKKIYKINTDAMAIEQTVTVDFGNDPVDSLLAFPIDIKVRDNKMFVAYYQIHARGDFSTPGSDEAKVAVFTYPGLQFEKIITDTRAPNLGRYYSTNALEMDENGDIYAYAPSSLACGYAPVPSKNSGVLRIKNGATEFDPDYYIDFEAISGGYKINDMIYVANGKAVVRVVQEVETDPVYLWATYAPTGSIPLLQTGILDLNTQSFSLLNNVPAAGGGWNVAHLVEGSKLHLGVSSSGYAGIYTIDVDAGTAVEGAQVNGNYAKGILSLKGI